MRPTVVYIGTVAIGLTIFELSEEVEVRYLDGQYVRVDQLPKRRENRWDERGTWTSKRDLPTGRLCLRATSPYPRTSWELQWRESNPGELAKKFPKIIRGLRAGAPEIEKLVEEGRRQAEKEHRRWKAQREIWRREEEERRRVKNIEDSKRELFAIIDSWALAKRIERFFEDVEGRIADLGEDERKSLLDRLRHARTLLGEIDALALFQEWKAPDEH